LGGKSEKINVLKVRSQCPLVLLVKVGCRQGKVSGSEGSSVMARGLLGCAERGDRLSVWAEFCLGRRATAFGDILMVGRVVF
jgi:hypothetical protein